MKNVDVNAKKITRRPTSTPNYAFIQEEYYIYTSIVVTQYFLNIRHSAVMFSSIL